MKKKRCILIVVSLLLMVLLTGCTIEDPGYVIIDDTDPVIVSIEGNPEVKIIDDEGNIITIDPITHTLVSLTYTHFEVHEGCMFKCDAVDEVMADGDELILAFKTPPDGKLAHIFGEFQTLVGGSFQLWENPTWDNQSGTLEPIINRKRESPFSSSILLEDQGQVAFVASNNLVLNPTGFDTEGEGQILLHHFYAFSEHVKLGGGSARDDEEFVLKNDTQYAYIFISTSDANKAWISLKWYEHQDGG